MKKSFIFLFSMTIHLVIIGCKNDKSKIDENIIYVCSMDPQVKEYKPGNCPVCKMPLTPISTEKSESPDELKLSDQQILLGNISTDTVTEHTLGKELFLTGTLVENQDKVTIISSRISGRIDNLYIKTLGQKVSKGQTIYTIYSEELLLTLNELKLAEEKKKNLATSFVDIDRIIRSARNKLTLFGLTDKQITELIALKELPLSIPINSSTVGVVSKLDIIEGGYVNAGDKIMHLSNYTSLWAQAEIFSEDLSKINQGTFVLVSIPALNQFDIKGVVSLINPSLNQNSKLSLIRVFIENKIGILKPGLQANFTIVYDSYSAIAVPTNSIILDEGGATIWVQTGINTFKSKMVETGTESNGFTEIKKGVVIGEIVVVTGAYLLNSEFIFQKGSSVMSGHDMEKM